MVATLNEDSMKFVVEGEDGRSRGLIACSFAVRPCSYDHKRCFSMQGPKTHKAVWDFVLHRADGSGIRLHPNWSSTKVETFDIRGHEQQVEPPAKGKGKSDGPGTFRKYKEIGNQRTLRFRS